MKCFLWLYRSFDNCEWKVRLRYDFSKSRHLFLTALTMQLLDWSSFNQQLPCKNHSEFKLEEMLTVRNQLSTSIYTSLHGILQTKLKQSKFIHFNTFCISIINIYTQFLLQRSKIWYTNHTTKQIREKSLTIKCFTSKI